jgi:hypothetical protein
MSHGLHLFLQGNTELSAFLSLMVPTELQISQRRKDRLVEAHVGVSYSIAPLPEEEIETRHRKLDKNQESRCRFSYTQVCRSGRIETTVSGNEKA